MQRRFIVRLSLAALLFAATAGDLCAQRAPGGRAQTPESIIQRLDRDGDGKVSREEFRGPPNRFAAIDADKDGYLTAEEFRAFRQGSAKRPANRAAPGRAGGLGALYFVDAHSQMDQTIDPETIIELMDRTGIYKTILAKHLERPWETVLQFAEAYPERIVPSVYTKSMTKEPRDIDRQVRTGRFRAMEEILLWHPKRKLSFGDRAVRDAIALAIGQDWPVVLHLEFREMSESKRDTYMRDLEALLAAHPGHPFVLIHLGQLETDEVRRLIAAHANLYFMASHSNLRSMGAGRRESFVDMFDGGERLAPRWRDILVDHPDRFVFALDNVFGTIWKRGHLPQMLLWRNALEALPPTVANAFAHGNAERLWKLAAKPDDRSAAARPGDVPMASGGSVPRAVRECPLRDAGRSEARWTIESYAPDCAFDGTTLFADGARTSSPRLVEVDMTGRIVWQYRIDQGVGRNLSDRELKRYQPMDVARLANGNTMFVLKQLGIYEVDKTGRLVWRHLDDGVSHDADRLANGNTLFVRGWTAKGGDLVREVAPDGTLVWSWNGLAQYDRAPFAGIEREGWMHVNSVTRLANGHTMIGMRNFEMLAEVDAAGAVVREIKFGGRRWESFIDNDRIHLSPHDPEVQPDGSVLVALTGRNRVILKKPGEPRPRWSRSWPRTDGKIVFIRDVNMLPNGDRLVTSHNAITEITADGQTVWRLTIPTLSLDRDNPNAESPLFKAQRIGPDGRAYGG